MTAKKSKSTLVMGIGNLYRRDDAAGLWVARRLGRSCAAAAEVSECGGEGVSLIESWNGRDRVILVDAVRSGAQPGTVLRVDAARREIPKTLFCGSTHAFSVAEAVELARALGKLPRELLIFGIEGKDFGAGEGLSPEVEKAVAAVEKEILKVCRA